VAVDWRFEMEALKLSVIAPRGGGLCVESADRSLIIDLLNSEFGISAKQLKSLAHLIAAAPEMFDAIEAAMRIPELWCPTGEPDAEHEGEYEALGIMFNNFGSALAKARGEE
jgi:hypothetical protein